MTARSHMLPLAGHEAWGPAICCEILPVTIVAGQVVHLRRSDAGEGIWHEPLACAHPSAQVRACLEAGLGAALDPRAAVIHSTAWRYEGEGGAGGRVILTYLAALAPGAYQAIAAGAMPTALEVVAPVPPARSDTLMPPAQIRLAHVLSHALDHLRLLMETDPAIRAALGAAWRAALRRRRPRPAGEIRLPGAALEAA